MSDKEATRFIYDLQTNMEFLEVMSKVKDDPKKTFDTVIAHGYDVTPEEITDAFLEFSSNSLSEKDLKEVAAGLSGGATAGIAVAGAVTGAGVAAGITAACLIAASSSAAAACI